MGAGLIFAALTAVCWSLLAIALKYALHFSSSGTIVWMRMVWAFLILAAFFAYKHPEALKKIFRAPAILVFGGLMLAVNYFSYMYGLELTSASNAQIMIQLGPLSFLLIGVFYFKEHLRWPQWVGIFAAFTGFSFFYSDQIQVAFANPAKYISGDLWLVLGAISWAVFAAIQKHYFTKGWSPGEQNLLVYGLCTLALLPLADFKELAPLDAWQWFVMFLLGLNTLVAYGAFAEANRRAPASYVSLIITCNPLLTIFLVKMLEYYGSDLITPEPIHVLGYWGAFLVVAGVGLAVSLRKGMPKPRLSSAPDSPVK